MEGRSKKSKVSIIKIMDRRTYFISKTKYFNNMIVTTTPTIEGHTIKEYKGLVSGEVIFGMNFLKDFGASLRDFFGGRTDSYEKAMLEGRETAQKEMRERAEKLGANAIVGVSFGYETMGQANSMIMISISGTAVVID